MIRILIVDDHEMVREGLRVILEPESDFEIVGEIGSADQLADVVERTRPDIVLLDARFPGVSGPEACRRLGVTHPEVRVIILTTYSDEDLVDESIHAGAKGYVIKDVERFELRQAIRAVYRGEAVLAPAIAGRILERMRSGGTSDSPVPPLTDGQREVLRLLAEGFSNREIAQRVYLSQNTVKTHVQEIFQKLGVRNRVEAALRATREHLI
jgi:two-component system, NarL family, response regulator DevR